MNSGASEEGDDRDMTRIQCTELDSGFSVPLYHVGPPLDRGPLPSIFYFSLSGHDSLTKDPFNQPVQFLSDRWIRFFSLTLPAHENGLDPHKAIQVWAEDISKGIDCLNTFFDQALSAIEFSVRQKLADPQKLALAGLSRGGFIASHIAARDERFRYILQFAPLTDLSKTKEFASLTEHPIVQSLALNKLAPQIADRHIRLYIGNKDTRVGTGACFDFASQLTAASTLRSPHIEFIMSSSIGLMGHGTSPEIFRQGALWLASCLT